MVEVRVKSNLRNRSGAQEPARKFLGLLPGGFSGQRQKTEISFKQLIKSRP